MVSSSDAMSTPCTVSGQDLGQVSLQRPALAAQGFLMSTSSRRVAVGGGSSSCGDADALRRPSCGCRPAASRQAAECRTHVRTATMVSAPHGDGLALITVTARTSLHAYTTACP